jgi:hypothetical protein
MLICKRECPEQIAADPVGTISTLADGNAGRNIHPSRFHSSAPAQSRQRPTRQCVCRQRWRRVPPSNAAGRISWCWRMVRRRSSSGRKPTYRPSFGAPSLRRSFGARAGLDQVIMKTKQLGNSDLFITPVGYGSWAIGGSGWQFAWGKQNDDDSIAAIHRALELGVNWIDTAAVYGLGHSEEIVARALASWKGPRPYVFTKCGLRWDAQGQTHRC